MVLEIFLIIIGLIAFFVWLATRKRTPDNVKDLELKLRELFHEREKEYLNQIQELKLQHKQELSDQERENTRQVKGFRQDAVKRSRNTLIGKLWETVAPYLPKFKTSWALQLSIYSNW